MVWNYDSDNCGLLVCTTSGGAFEKGKKYPFYNMDGISYIIAIDLETISSVVYVLDSYEDCTYKIVGALDEFENAVFEKDVI
jgi:hypothetical protein